MKIRFSQDLYKVKTPLKFIKTAFVVLSLLISAQASFAARCHNFSSKHNIDNRLQCELLKAEGATEFACKLGFRGQCHSKCASYIFADVCMTNPACEWHDTVENQCREKHDGWKPDFGDELIPEL
jgi:hypothetical protein